jgi:hypothetical protein
MASNFLKVRLGLNLGQLSADTASPQTVYFYYSSTTNTIRFYNGTAWSNIADTKSVTTDSTTTGSAQVIPSGDIAYSIKSSQVQVLV